MAKRERTYSEAHGKVQFGLAGLWVLLGLLNTIAADRVFAVFCLLCALGSGLHGANESWWRGTNRWFKPALLALLAAMIVCAGVFVSSIIGDIRADF